MEPRVVLVSRPSELAELVDRHGTLRQAAWYLERQGVALADLQQAHARLDAALAAVSGAIPPTWRRVRVARSGLDRFLFEPEDVIVAVGQDGLVANVAKYLEGQPVVGVNPDPDRIDGVLVRHPVAAAADLLRDVAAGRARPAARTMVEASTDDGQRLRALNEVFLGHRSHQSARYTLAVGGQTERQSSSGLLVSTGTGATGWALSVSRAIGAAFALPQPTDPALAWFVREPWPSRRTGATVTAGLLAGGELVVCSEMNGGGVLFGDGLEDDAIALPWGRRVRVGPAPVRLHLV